MQRLTAVLLLCLLPMTAVLVSCDDEDPAQPQNQAPEVPTNPDPEDGAIQVALDITLAWDCEDPDGDDLSYDLFFGTELTRGPVATNLEATSFAPGALEADQTYVWKVVARDHRDHATSGPVWSFTTTGPPNGAPAAPVDPIPVDGALEVALPILLSWSGSDPDGDPLRYDVYFGEGTPLALVSANQNGTSFDPGDLAHETSYAWKVVARDDHARETAGPLWSFTTEPSGILEREFPLGDTGLTVTMIWIEPGSFLMGALPGEQGANGDEYPRHVVTLAEGFWMGKYEVTQKQWDAVVGTNWPFRFDGHPDRPAEYISWNHVHSYFLAALNQLETGSPWRLPSEAEWEYACRAGTQGTRFWWGNDPGYTQLGDHAWYWDNDDIGNGHETHDVGLKLPNPWGLHDMHGNVWEWCEDSYHFNYNGAPSDGSPWTDTPSNGRVARGGGWGEYGRVLCRTAARARDSPLYGYPIFGFRLVRVVD